MSAVAAILSLDGSPVRREEWEPMAARLRDFGRDRQWQWTPPGEPVALFRALDELTPSDVHATATAAAGDWVLVGDVRLDARPALAASLGLAATEAAGLSDEQLFALALEKWGVDAPARIVGSYALIAWEISRRRLHLWRDPNGDGALFIHRGAHRIFVSSRPPVLLATRGVPREVDVIGLLNYMTDNRRPGRTSLGGIEALGIGRHRVFGADRTDTERVFWQPPDEWAWTRTEIKNPVETLRAVFTEAVKDRLRLLGTTAGFCSGGLDSTAIAAVAATELARTGGRYRTYTSVPHPDWREPARNAIWENDDAPYVQALASHHPNIDATFVAMNGGIFLDCLPAIFRESGQPLRNTSNLPWWTAIRALGQADGARGMFVGAGGNGTISLDTEILPDLLAARRFSALLAEFRASPREFLRAVRKMLGAGKARLRAKPERQAIAEIARRMPLNLAAATALGWHPILRLPQLRSLARARRRTLEIPAGELGLGGAGWGRLDPTRDRRVVELCRLLPPQEFRHGSERRRLIRRAMVGLLPDEIRLRTTRGAQAPDYPMHLGRRLADLRDALEFIARDSLCASLLDLTAMRKILQDWPARASVSQFTSLIPFERGLTLGLYICWVNRGLDDLPGNQPLRPLIIDSGGQPKL